MEELSFLSADQVRTVQRQFGTPALVYDQQTLEAQAREAVAEELVRRADEQNDQLSKTVCMDGVEHMRRSLQTGD